MIRGNTQNKREGVQKKSIEKVWNVLKQESNVITISCLANRVSLHISSVKSCLRFLESLDKIEFITNGKTTFVKKKECENGFKK